ncbi:MAG: TGS domain-containing protein [Gammaproteobacteria bacterium]|nr:TGS domain-containing protein [Gammaproteobacteria bacterium]MCY4218719.1 TGS domain-containing protein [Gammaproteobacteria bacterium]MCY4275426.1 TGS domain-containing protein [Gammaproteobacteria bacterium]
MSVHPDTKIDDNRPVDLELIRGIFCEYSVSYRDLGNLTAMILTEIGAGPTTVAAGYLAAIGEIQEKEHQQLTKIARRSLLQLYQNSMFLNTLSVARQNNLSSKDDYHPIEENLRKMLIAMVDDGRVVLIGLALQLAKLKLGEGENDEDYRQLVHATKEIYAPLANRMGVFQLKWQLEDLSFRNTQPETYQRLAKLLNEKRKQRERFLNDVVHKVQSGISSIVQGGRVYGRPKHIYSIWKKMNQKGIEFDQLWDIRAIRILVNTVDECYQCLSYVHGRWEHFSDEFEDYIAMPKKNGYRSIHTVISGPQNKAVEVQIRTFEMHQESELGLAAHWRYKEGIEQDINIENKIIWLRELLEWKRQIVEPSGIAEQSLEASEDFIQKPSEDDRVYVFTPQGKVVDLPRDSTPLDFAYAIHSEIGHRARGALVDGKMVALHKRLKTGNRVQIQTVKSGGPSLDWLRNDRGYVQTSRARQRILQWFRHEEYDRNVSVGRGLLERELVKLGMTDLSYEKINQHTHYRKVDDLFAAIATGDYKINRALQPFKVDTKKNSHDQLVSKRSKGKIQFQKPSRFIVQGIGNLMVRSAKCCSPVPGDQIVGYITTSEGITVHRQDCGNIVKLSESRRQRLIEVEWGELAGSTYILALEIVAYQRENFLSNVHDQLKSRNIEILKVDTRLDDREKIMYLSIQLEVPETIRYKTVIEGLKSIQDILEVHRTE